MRLLALVIAGTAAQACATLQQLGQIIRPLHFEQAAGRRAEVRLAGPSRDSPLGGAAIRIWTTVSNQNPIGVTLSTVRATLLIEGTRAADGNFPLGLPLQAGQQSTIPLDLTVSFSDVPALASVLRRVIAAQPVGFEVEGTFGVEAGRLGTPTFGPMTLFTGELGGSRVASRTRFQCSQSLEAFCASSDNVQQVPPHDPAATVKSKLKTTGNCWLCGTE